MKRIIFLACLGLLTFSSFAQEIDTLEVRKDVTKYFDHNEKAEWDSLITMLVPEFVDLFTPEMLLQQMEQLATNPNFAVTFRDMRIHKLHDGFTREGTSFILVDHEFVMEFAFKKEEDQTEEEFKSFVDFMTMSFEAQYTVQEVTRNEENNTVAVKPQKTTLAVKKADYDTWKFIDYEPQNEMIYNMIFSEEVVAMLKSKFKKPSDDD